ncbi:hypothetical protein HXX76_008910 [Chlamydomonas incerta]|uniref:Protein kinase domain-containing protein n=1 Tax=Chlamydomonas incerta TaxID=51695 RepID=A0A835VYG7_CHLIN|nr:hypothetical protein HXX76_008910 [Chlamydomonas incerta]|eukprot:KAG2432565.1 hypothetical protein HXX76_008910 [Chlamydomonas incerta]
MSLASAELVLAAHLQARLPGLVGTSASAQAGGGAAPAVSGLWTWDASRLCRAALLTPRPAAAAATGGDAPPPVLVSLEGRPCAQRLPYVCVLDADVRAAGLTPSSEWVRTHGQNVSSAGAAAGDATAATGLVVGSSSPHLQGPERSGLVLLRSGYALGGTRVPLGLKAEEWGKGLLDNSKPPYSQLRTSAFDDSELFWSRGPVVSAFFRSQHGRLLALRPVREAEAEAEAEAAAAAATDAAAAEGATTSSTTSTTTTTSSSLLSGGVFGASRPDLDTIAAPYETHHVGPYRDYIVSVQGCFRTLAVEVLVLTSRSGRRYRLGRGSCTVWFREDAPPGGYLAGFAGLQLDVGHLARQQQEQPLPWAEGQLLNAPWLMQVELVWAAPAGSPPPAYTQRLPALLRHSTAQIAPPSSACPGAYPLSSLTEELMHYCTWPWRELWPSYTYAPITGVGCPSNTCCRKPLYVPGEGVYVPYNYTQPTCSADLSGCTRSCQVQAGLCGVVPDRPALHFALSPPAPSDSLGGDMAAAGATPTAAAAVGPQSFIVFPDAHVSYEAAADMCRSSNYMGLTWRFPLASEVLAWSTALDIRNPAYEALTDLGYFWLGDVGGASSSDSGTTLCATALYGSGGAAGGGSGSGDGGAGEYDRVTYDSSAPCYGVAAVVCAAAAPLDPAVGSSSGSSSGSSTGGSRLVQPADGRDAGGRTWSPGPHRLTASRRGLGSGNYGNITCSATLLEAASSGSSSSNSSSKSSSSSTLGSGAGGSSNGAGSSSGASQQQQQLQQQPALATNLTVGLTAPPRAFLVSAALQASDVGNSVSAVSALGVELGGGAAAAAAASPAAAATVLTAGNPSTRSWHRLELLPGEVVVAASGCAGGHLELLLLHTSSGRVLAPPLTAGPEGAAAGSAACTSSFAEAAPAGGYLVGFQLTYGQFIESVRLLWGQPLTPAGAAAASGGSSSDGSVASGSGGEGFAGHEGRGGALDSAVGSSPGASELWAAGPHGEQQPAAGSPPSGNRSAPQPGSSGGSGGGGGGAVSPAVIGGAVAGGIAVLLAVALAAVYLHRRRSKQQQHQQAPEGKQGGHVKAADCPLRGGDNPPPSTSASSSGGSAAASTDNRGGSTSGSSCSRTLAGECGAIPLNAARQGSGTASAAVSSAGQTVSSTCGAPRGEACVTLVMDVDRGERAAAVVALPAAGGAVVAEDGNGHTAAGTAAAGTAGGVLGVLRYAAPTGVLPHGRLSASVRIQHACEIRCEAVTGLHAAPGAAAAAAAGAAAPPDRADPRPGFDAMATAPVARVVPLRVPVTSKRPPQQSLSQRQLHQAEAAPRSGGLPGRDADRRSGSGSVAASSTCRPADSLLPRLPSSNLWEQRPPVSRLLHQLPSSSQSMCCAVPVMPGEQGGHATPARQPAAPQAQGHPPATSPDEDFRSRLCAYVSSCQTLSSVAERCSVVDADAHVAAALRQKPNDSEVWVCQQRQQRQEQRQQRPAHGGFELQQCIEESLTTAQAELLAAGGRKQAQAHHGAACELVLASVLGKGAFGVVFNGTWRGLRVAVKTLVVHDSLAGAETRQRHRAIVEAAISKSLRHLNVVTTYETQVVPLSVPAAARDRPAPPDRADAAAGAGSAAGGGGASGDLVAAAGDLVATGGGGGVQDPTSDTYKLLLVMEYCDAGSLARALEMGAVGSVAAGGAARLCALTLALDVACGMKHIHARNIVHGDLSAGNILLSSTAAAVRCHGGDAADAPLRAPLAGMWAPPVVAKVADFGLSVHMGEHHTHASNRYQGTPAYTAPEVLFRGRLSAAADVWSFGCLLLELAHGERIGRIRARAAGDAAAAAAAAAPAAGAAGGQAATVHWAEPPPGSSPRLAQLLAACLAMDPSARPSFDQVTEALVAILVESHSHTMWCNNPTMNGASQQHQG